MFIKDRIYEDLFSRLPGNDQLCCRLVCRNWEEIVTASLPKKCCLNYQGRPKFLLAWLINKAKNFTTPTTRFVKACKRNPSLVTAWDELRIQRLMPKSSKKFVVGLRSPDLNQAISFNNITALQITDSMFRFQRLHSFFELLPNLVDFSDIQTDYTLDWSICFKTFGEIQDSIARPFLNTHCKIRNLVVKRDDAGFKTLFLMKLIGLTCENLESFDLHIDTYEYPFPLALLERMDYSSVVGVLLNGNRQTLQKLRFHWVGHLTYHFYDDFLRCIGVMSWTQEPWHLTKVEFHFDWIFLGNPDFHGVLVPFVQRLECLEELKMRNIILQAEWAEILDQVKPNNYDTKKPVVEFGVMLSDNAQLSTGQTSVNVIGNIAYLREAIKIIRVSITSEYTDELKKVLPLGGCDEFPGTSELYIIKGDWKPHMRFIMYNTDKICETFKNLTLLVIADGDRVEYRKDLRSHKQWNHMSNAHIGDDDMQLILKNLVRLKILRLRCRMFYLTDKGTVGITEAALSQMKAKMNSSEIPEPKSSSLSGVSFHNLSGTKKTH